MLIPNESGDEALYEFIEILESHCKSCERQGKYQEADIARDRLEELKKHDENRRKEILRSRQIAEKLGVEEAHMREFQQFNIDWDKKMNDFETNASIAIKIMEERHDEELKEFQRSLIGKQIKPRFSRDLLNLRKIQDTVAKQRNYPEAQKIKNKADALEAWEIEKWHNTRQTDLVAKEEKFKLLKKNEMNGLLKRLKSSRDENIKQRHADLQRLLQRYRNLKVELEIQHSLEKSRLEKDFQQAATILTRSGSAAKFKGSRTRSSLMIKS